MYADVWFYSNANDPRKSWMNQLVTAVDPPFCHCEIQFPNGDAFGVYSGSRVVCRERTFNTAHYTCLRIACTPNQLSAMRTTCQQLVDDHAEFHSLCLASTVFGTGLLRFVNLKKHTCCSRLVGSALVAAEILPNGSENCSPSLLYKCLLPHSCPVGDKSYALDFCD